jgi:pSer/pThr/pTyr-binding forkhead associated (FHA) protein
MEEDDLSFNSTLSNLSGVQPNYQTLKGDNTLLNNSNSGSTSSLSSQGSSSSNGSESPPQQQQQQQQQQNLDLDPDNIPYAIFLFRSNSVGVELYEERRIPLDKACKIGRSVAKIRPEPNNAIFDCKVLSRNHALLWHDNSKFYLQDTKSSNGTFLNGTRLGKSNEDSLPFDVNSGDIIQFGVDVTENTKKVTHGCITVEIKLFLRAGCEALGKQVMGHNATGQANKVDVQTQELYQLALFLQEAIMREDILHQKLSSLQGFIDQASETSEQGWLTLIEEDRLLSRIDVLEKQLILASKPYPSEDTFKKSINTLREETASIETSAKQSVQSMIEEKNEIAQKLDQLKVDLSSRDEECLQLKGSLDQTKENLIDLASKYQKLLSQIDELNASIGESNEKSAQKQIQMDTDKSQWDARISELTENEKAMVTQIESLIAEKDFQTKRLEGIMCKLETQKVAQLQNGHKEEPNDIAETKIEPPLKQEAIIPNNIAAAASISSPHLNSNGISKHHFDHDDDYDNDYDQLLDNDNDKSDQQPDKQADTSITALNNNVNYQLFNREMESLKQKLDAELSKNSKLNLQLDQMQTKADDDNQNDNDEITVADSSNLKEIKFQLDLLETGIEDYFRDNQKSENLHKILGDSMLKLKSIRLLIDKQSEPQPHSQSENKFETIESNENYVMQIKHLQSECESIRSSWQASESLVEELTQQWDGLNLRARIVSYVSMVPLCILLMAILIAFYPILATITATGL